MIILFIGTVGGGKTVSMTYEGYQYYKKGMKIFSNYHLSYPHELLTKKRFDEMIEDNEQLQDAVIMLDELHIWLDSRNSMQGKNKAMTYFVLQTRKRNVRLLGTTQHFDQVDKRFRNSVDILVFCRNINNTTSLVQNDGLKDTYIHQEFTFQWTDKKNRHRIIHANPLFKLYDTREIVSFTD